MADAQTAQTATAADVAKVLGGRKVLSARVDDAFDMLELVRSGLPYESLEKVRESLGVPGATLSDLIGTPERTLARRRRDNQLNPNESDRLYRVAHVVALARTVLGSEKKASAWLGRDNRALGGQPPLALLDTEPGARRVEDVLVGLGHGFVS